MPYAYDYVQGASKALRFNRIFIFNQETSLLIRPIDEGNYRRFIYFCKRFLYNTPFVTFMDLRWTAVRIDKEKGKMVRGFEGWSRLRFYHRKRFKIQQDGGKVRFGLPRCRGDDRLRDQISRLSSWCAFCSFVRAR